MKLEALIVSDMDVDILAGTPFMTLNDVSVRPARQEITFGGKVVLSYDQSPPPSVPCPHHRPHQTRAGLLRVWSQTIVYPGEYLEVDIPASLADEELLAVEPCFHTAHCEWPPPSIKAVVDGKVTLSNPWDMSIHLSRNKHFCQVLPTQACTDSTDSQLSTCTEPYAIRPFSDGVSLDPDGMMPTDTWTKFAQTLHKYQDVFDPNYQGYSSHYDKLEAVVNMGPVLPSQRKGRVPQYSKPKLGELQAMFDTLETEGIFKRPEEVGVTVEYFNPSFL